jgi:hypothetical protein
MTDIPENGQRGDFPFCSDLERLHLTIWWAFGEADRICAISWAELPMRTPVAEIVAAKDRLRGYLKDLQDISCGGSDERLTRAFWDPSRFQAACIGTITGRTAHHAALRFAYEVHEAVYGTLCFIPEAALAAAQFFGPEDLPTDACPAGFQEAQKEARGILQRFGNNLQITIGTPTQPDFYRLFEELQIEYDQALLRHAPPPRPLDPPPPRFVIDRETCCAVFDGQRFHGLDPDGLRVLLALQQEQGKGWVPSSRLMSLTNCNHEKTLERWINRLPLPLRKLIQAKKGSGRALVFPPLNEDVGTVG